MSSVGSGDGGDGGDGDGALINRLPGELLAKVFCHVDDAKTLLIAMPSVSTVLGSITTERSSFQGLSRRLDSGLTHPPTHAQNNNNSEPKKGLAFPSSLQWPASSWFVLRNPAHHRCWHCFPDWC